MEKKLMINCGICDARTTTEETLSAYEQITINCGEVFVSPETRGLLTRHNVTMNCGNVRELDKDVVIRSVNGKAQIRSTDTVGEKVFLFVNGKLDIGPDTQQILKQYMGISVNGKVLCPESVSNSLDTLTVNGKLVIYPDDAILLKRNAVIDRTFVLRAKAKRYWSEKRMIFVDPRMDPNALAAKGAFFSAEEVILAESMVQPLIEQIDEKAELIIVPDGTSVIPEELTLNALTIKKYGTKLYVLDDVEVDSDAAQTLEQLEYLNIQGDAKVPNALKELLLEKAERINGDIAVKKGRCIADKISLRISKATLEREADGIQVEDCAKVTLDADIPGELILEKLSLRDCALVRCTPEQEDALALVSEDVAHFSTGEEEEAEDSMGIGQQIKAAMGVGKDLLNTRVINAGDYIL